MIQRPLNASSPPTAGVAARKTPRMNRKRIDNPAYDSATADAVLTIYMGKDDSVTEWDCGFGVPLEQSTMTSRFGPFRCCLALLASAAAMSAATAKAPQELPFTEHQRSHWAFQPVASPDIPNEGQENPIDAFVAARMRDKGLGFAPAADKVTLIRRATFGLHGLPPTPEEVQSFLDDNSTDAFAKVVDRLLASPRYGETWARHWLDLARFAESEGFKSDETRPKRLALPRLRDRLAQRRQAVQSIRPGADCRGRAVARKPRSSHRDRLQPELSGRVQRGDPNATPPGNPARHHRHRRWGIHGSDLRLRQVPRPQIRPDSPV